MVMTEEQANDLLLEVLSRTVEQPNGCLEWTGARTTAGYGLIQRRKMFKSPMSVHRLVWTAAHGEIPDGMGVLHKCDNPPCLRLKHLFLGDDQANTDDKLAKGRHRHGHLYGDDHPARKHPELVPRGEAHPMVKLTLEQVEQIRLRPTENAAALGKEFGVSRHAINAIRAGRTWKN
jgi:hypothetical protein